LCLLLTPRPSPSTLFPYTTLFRSRAAEFFRKRLDTRTVGPRRGRRQLAREPSVHEYDREGVLHKPEWRHVLVPDRWRSSLAEVKDRKSTRLNSSHEWISYAVFRLK